MIHLKTFERINKSHIIYKYKIGDIVRRFTDFYQIINIDTRYSEVYDHNRYRIENLDSSIAQPPNAFWEFEEKLNFLTEEEELDLTTKKYNL